MKWKGTPVFNPHNPRDLYKNGGYVYSSPHMSQKQLANDSVVGILRPGEIVIPIKYKNRNASALVKRYLLANKIYLPHLKK